MYDIFYYSYNCIFCNLLMSLEFIIILIAVVFFKKYSVKLVKLNYSFHPSFYDEVNLAMAVLLQCYNQLAKAIYLILRTPAVNKTQNTITSAIKSRRDVSCRRSIHVSFSRHSTAFSSVLRTARPERNRKTFLRQGWQDWSAETDIQGNTGTHNLQCGKRWRSTN